MAFTGTRVLRRHGQRHADRVARIRVQPAHQHDRQPDSRSHRRAARAWRRDDDAIERRRSAARDGFHVHDRRPHAALGARHARSALAADRRRLLQGAAGAGRARPRVHRPGHAVDARRSRSSTRRWRSATGRTRIRSARRSRSSSTTTSRGRSSASSPTSVPTSATAIREPQMYVPHTQLPTIQAGITAFGLENVTFVVRSNARIEDWLPGARAAAKEIDPAHAVNNVQLVAEFAAQQTQGFRQYVILLGVFSVHRAAAGRRRHLRRDEPFGDAAHERDRHPRRLRCHGAQRARQRARPRPGR